MKSDSLNSNFAYARFHQVPSDRTRTKFILRLRLDSSSALCVKNFRESYVFHCLVIKVSVVFDSSFSLPHLFELVKNFFQVFSKFFFSMCCCRLFADDLFTLSCIQSFVNYFFSFLKNFWFFMFSETIISDSSIRLPQQDTSVNYFFHFFPNKLS